MIALNTPISLGQIDRLAVTRVEALPDLAYVDVAAVADSGAELGHTYRLKIRNGRCDVLRRKQGGAPGHVAGILEQGEASLPTALDLLLRAWHSGEGREAALANVERAGMASGWLDNTLRGAVS